MSEKTKSKPFDMTTVLLKATTATSVPCITHRGKKVIDWQPLIKLVIQKGIVKFSEKDVNIVSMSQGIRKYAISQNMTVVTNFRKVDDIVWLFISKPKQ